MEVNEILGFKDGVALKLRAPMAVRSLLPQEPILRLRNGALKPIRQL
jgi:hypothetical protein